MVDNQLNNAYYDPSIPSPSKSDRRRHNNNGCGFCGCFKGCGGCIFSLICKIITTIIIIVAIIGFLFWFIVRPDALKFSVSEASLTLFNFTNNNTFLSISWFKTLIEELVSIMRTSKCLRFIKIVSLVLKP